MPGPQHFVQSSLILQSELLALFCSPWNSHVYLFKLAEMDELFFVTKEKQEED